MLVAAHCSDTQDFKQVNNTATLKSNHHGVLYCYKSNIYSLQLSKMSGKPDPYADIDFEEINDQTNLANDEIKCLKVG